MGRVKTERTLKSEAEWRKKQLRQINFSLNISTESDIIEKLDSVSNRQKYLKDLIRADMAKNDPVRAWAMRTVSLGRADDCIRTMDAEIAQSVMKENPSAEAVDMLAMYAREHITVYGREDFIQWAEEYGAEY